MQHVAKLHGHSIYVKIHIFPLPFHYGSFAATRAAYWIAEEHQQYNTNMQFISKMFDNRHLLSDWRSKEKTFSEFEETIASIAEIIGLEHQKIKSALQENRHEKVAKSVWKQGAQRKVHGTPQYFVGEKTIPWRELDSMRKWDLFVSELIKSTSP